MRRGGNTAQLAAHAILLGGAAFFLVLHLVHLLADFPNFSPWMDWSKYTDEGWYGDAAIRHFNLGHWYVPGDFNPAAALPVWPLFEGIVFHFTGVSLLAARALTVAVFACTLIAVWFLLTRWARRSDRHRALSPSIAVLLLAVSPFCFVFTRLAILEPLLVLLMVLSLLVAGQATRTANSRPSTPDRRAKALNLLRLNARTISLLGLLLPALVLTKTTALFLFPAIAWLLFAALEFDLFALLAVGLSAGAVALGVWLAYFVLAVRPHFLSDYRYLFSANAYTAITRENFFSVLLNTVTDGMWIGKLLYPLALLAVVFTLLQLRRLRAHPSIGALLLWSGGYAAFLAYHNNLQPRYYLVIAVPLTMLVPVVFEELLLPRVRTSSARTLALGAAVLAGLAIVLPEARETISYVRHPQYTLLTAAREVNSYIREDRRKDPAHSPLVLSISGSDLSLMTGLPSICDDFGTLELGDRVKLYQPGWYVAWNQIDDDKMDAMTPYFHIERVAAYPAMDDPDRNLMILYRLDPAATTPHKLGRRRPIPRRLLTKIGQQPSAEQLAH